MFSTELKTEFLERVEVILNNEDLSTSDKKTIIGKLYVDFEKKNKAQLSKLVIPQIKEKRKPTEYNIFIKEKMEELKNDVIQSKFRFQKASNLWNNK